MSAEQHVDPQLLDALALEVARSGTAAHDASHELLAHYSDTGSAHAQRAVDTLVDHAADTLRALTDSFADISAELQVSAREESVAHPGAGGPADAGRPFLAPGPGSGQ
jgi:hypothetical protein